MREDRDDESDEELRTVEGVLLLIVALLVIAAALSLVGCAPTPPPQAPRSLLTVPPCLTYSPPPLLDTHLQEVARPTVQRALVTQLQQWGGVPRLLYSTGNEIVARTITDPLHPGGGSSSRFSWLNGGPVECSGDRDYNLAGFAVCDDCEYGVAGYYEMGTVVFSFDAQGRFVRLEHYGTAYGRGGVTFRVGSTQYLVANNLPGGGCGSTAVLWRVDDVDQLSDPQCLRAGTRPIPLAGGRHLDGFLYLADEDRGLHVFRVLPSGAAEYVSTPGSASYFGGAGLSAVSGDHLATAAGAIYLWDVSDLAAPRLVHSWRPGGKTFSLVALSWPYLWAAPTGGPPYLFDVSNPTSPRALPWSEGEEQGWYGTLDRDAMFSSGYLWAARYSSLQRYSVCEPAAPELVFADGFESGDCGAWAQ